MGGASRFPEDPRRPNAGPRSLIFRTPAPSRGRLRRIMADREKSEKTAPTHRDGAIGLILRFARIPLDIRKIIRDCPRIRGVSYFEHSPPSRGRFRRIQACRGNQSERRKPAALGRWGRFFDSHGASRDFLKTICGVPYSTRPAREGGGGGFRIMLGDRGNSRKHRKLTTTGRRCSFRDSHGKRRDFLKILCDCPRIRRFPYLTHPPQVGPFSPNSGRSGGIVIKGAIPLIAGDVGDPRRRDFIGSFCGPGGPNIAPACAIYRLFPIVQMGGPGSWARDADVSVSLEYRRWKTAGPTDRISRLRVQIIIVSVLFRRRS